MTKPKVLSPSVERPGVALLRSERATSIGGPLHLVFDALTKKVKLRKASGVTKALAPLGSQCLIVPNAGMLGAGESRTLVVKFANPLGKKIKYTPRVLAGVGAP